MSILQANRIYRLGASPGKHRPLASKPRRVSERNDGLGVDTPVTIESVSQHDLSVVATAPPTLPLQVEDTTKLLEAAPVTKALTASAGVAVQRKRRWTPWRVAGWVGLGLLVSVLAYIGWVAAAFLHLREEIYHPRLPTATVNPVVVKGTATALSVAGITVTPTADPYENLPTGRINILVLGSDKRPDKAGLSPRSDTLILVNLDTQTRVVRMLTIPRDLAVEIPGYPGKNKINAAYFLGESENGPGGGPALAADTISRLLSVPVDYYVMVNFEGFLALLDTLGGVDLEVPSEIDDYHFPGEDPNDPFAEIHVHFDAGWQHMDGREALRYARTRHADNDFMRSKRQLQIIMAMKSKASSLDLIPKLPGVLDKLAGTLETDIPPDKQLSLLQAGFDLDPSHILTMTIGAELVTPLRLPDRSEALSLNVKKAKPLLDAFFGRQPNATPTRTPTKTPVRRVPTATQPVTRKPTATPGVR